MRKLLMSVVVAGWACGSAPTPEQVRATYERDIVKAIEQAAPGVTVQVTVEDIQVIGSPDSCRKVLALVTRATLTVPKGQVIACGVAGDVPAWRLRERGGELVESRI